MKANLSKATALALSAFLAASLFSCGNTPSSQISGESASPVGGDSSASEAGESTPETVNPLMKYSPPITLTTAKSEGNFQFPDGEDYQNNDMYKLWEETMGVQIVNKIQCPGSAFKEKMQMAIATNDIPDFGVVDATMLRTMIKNDMVEDMTTLYDVWASENLKEVTGQSDNALFAPVLKDGNYMALPLVNTVADQIPILWTRSDWLKRLGLSEPKTIEEFFETAKAFATEDPDGNGADDTYGLWLDKDLGYSKHIFASYNAYMDQWIKQPDGSFTAGCTDPNMKNALQAMQELYSVGGIDPEFAVKDSAKMDEQVAAGKVGFVIGYFWWPLNALKDCVANVEGADWSASPMPASKDHTPYQTSTELNTAGYLYVKKGIEHPEAAVVMMNHICDGYGAPWLAGGDTDFALGYQKIASDPKYKNTAVNAMMPFTLAGNINWGPVFQKAVDDGETHVAGKDQDYQNVISTQLPKEMQWAWKATYLKAYPVLGDFENLHYNDYPGAPTDTAVKVQSLLDKERLTTFIAIIMGEKDVSEFDVFVQRYNSIGADKIAKEIEASYS